MSESKLEEKHIALWKRYVAASKTYCEAVDAILNEIDAPHRIKLVRSAFKNREHRHHAFLMIRYMTIEERKALLDILVGSAYSNSGLRSLATELILSIPKEWLIANIEKYTEPILGRRENAADYCSGFLSLFSDIDDALTLRLAQRAVRSEDEDVREIGEFYLERLQGKKN